MRLDQPAIDMVKASAPALLQCGTELTRNFYNRMLQESPQLKDVFNLAHQRDGSQPQALFDFVCAYATHIEQPAQLAPLVEHIAHKHASLNITPDMYDIVGRNLLASIQELINPGEEVIAAWARAYGVLADIFIRREARIYKDMAEAHGGWRGLRPFRVMKKIAQSSVITSFELSALEGPLRSFIPGQYISISVRAPGWEHTMLRQYSLTGAPGQGSYRIAVRREDMGCVSRYLHDEINEGDILHLTPPAGEFTLQLAPGQDVMFLSGGVGQTPFLSMLHELALKKHEGLVHWLHATRDEQTHAFAQEVESTLATLPNTALDIWYESPSDTQRCHLGLMDVTTLAIPPQARLYMCGPLPFLRTVYRQLKQRGISDDRIFYENFGSLQPLA